MSGPAWRFAWSAFATDELVAELLAAVGHPAAAASAAAGPERALLAPLVERCLAAAGGLPVWRGAAEPTPAMRTAIGRTRLAEALAHAARGRVAAAPANGLVVEDTPPGSPITGRVRAIPVVHVNTADAAAIDALPGIGTAVAARIVAERLARGPYRDAEDLARRVEGLGPARLHTLRTVLACTDPARLPWAPRLTGDFAPDVAALAAMQPGATPLARLEALLRRAAEAGARAPHPATRAHRVRPVAPPWPALPLVAEAAAPLIGTDYRTHLLAAFAAAASRIEVCMFHVAWPGPAHPTGALLEALIAARSRGGVVRVLLDQDRDDDPYRSTVINARAARHLLQGGVEVRCDTPERLLHSKVVLVDDALAVVGSHNWSAGSYERVDDVSMAIVGAAPVAALRARFEARWAAASPWPAPAPAPAPAPGP